jgi:hypothetical protein
MALVAVVVPLRRNINVFRAIICFCGSSEHASVPGNMISYAEQRMGRQMNPCRAAQERLWGKIL